MIGKNTPQLWDRLWRIPSSSHDDLRALLKEENGARWYRIEELVRREFGTFSGLEVIEIGAGRGINAALMAKKGAIATVLDYSEEALMRSEEFFARINLDVHSLLFDVLLLPHHLHGRFDIAMSFGLAEHFCGVSRALVVKAHLDLLRKGGVALISVPNSLCFPYQIYKFISQKRGKWLFGEEIPYSRSELRKICRKIEVSDYFFFGGSFIESFNLINYPSRLFMRYIKKQRCPKDPPIRREKLSFLDQYFAYSLVLCAKKL